MAGQLVQVFFKAPEPGLVKTRLIPDVGIAKATEIHTHLVRHVVAVVENAQADAIQYWVSGNIKNLNRLSLPVEPVIQSQQGTDLGARMLHALITGLQEFDKVVIVGGDAYSLCGDYIRQAFCLLDESDCVLGPAEDGGYILLAAKRVHSQMFAGIHWGKATVLAEQLQRFDELELSYQLLEERWDIDNIVDIKKHAPELLG